MLEMEDSGKAVQKFSTSQTWIGSIREVVKYYKDNFFGNPNESHSDERTHEFSVKPTIRFVMALYTDGVYRPGNIIGRCKKILSFAVFFYHAEKCIFVHKKNIYLKHGNLLNSKVFFVRDGKKMKGKVFGNNAPANKGFPTVFYIKKDGRWYKVDYKSIFLTRKQLIYGCINRNRDD